MIRVDIKTMQKRVKIIDMEYVFLIRNKEMSIKLKFEIFLEK